jgi:hypothetical protein
LTCLSPVVVDPLVVRPVQVALALEALVPVARVQPPLPLPLVPKAHVQALVLVLVLAQWGNAQGVLASPVKALPRTPRWLDRTLA